MFCQGAVGASLMYMPVVCYPNGYMLIDHPDLTNAPVYRSFPA